ncbi:MAG TPA: isoprenylcysteine carboxylmethyltransferase family protein [Candidatus Sulfotelmatobacter sp.]|nr:isoprenylcysteine carboxylmethyltransferase family protein [Candidatus Sulfotelmatobacter sp.]
MERVSGAAEMSLTARGTRQLVKTFVVLTGLLFVPAGTWRFWQGWLYIGLMFGFWTYFFVDLLKSDPQLLERRMQRRETEPQQRLLLRLVSLILFLAFMLAGVDFRFGWSRALGSVPVALVLAGQVIVVAGYWLVFWTMKVNSFASSIIQVEAQQTVIDRGPYAWVRHPMYLGMALSALALPLALGSYIALPLFALLPLLLGYRLVHEERTLCRDLAGYAEYCQRVRYRLLPWVW